MDRVGTPPGVCYGKTEALSMRGDPSDETVIEEVGLPRIVRKPEEIISRPMEPDPMCLTVLHDVGLNTCRESGVWADQISWHRSLIHDCLPSRIEDRTSLQCPCRLCICIYALVVEL